MIPGDPACYRGSDVLINKHDLRDPEMARAVEYKFAFARELELEVAPIHGRFDFTHLRAIHRHVFQDSYEWAGEIRDLDFAKRSRETGTVARFTRLTEMDATVQDFDAFMQSNDQLHGLPKHAFVRKLAEVHTRLNAIHPFREGNGRATRIFMRQLAREAGHELRIDQLDPLEWNVASHKAQDQYPAKGDGLAARGNQIQMRQVLDAAIRPTVEHAFRHEAKNVALRLYPGLQSYYERLDGITQKAHAVASPAQAQRLVSTAQDRLCERLQEDRLRRQCGDARDRLEEIRPGFKEPYGRSGEYETLAAAAMREVYVRRGFRDSVIDRALDKRFVVQSAPPRSRATERGIDMQR